MKQVGLILCSVSALASVGLGYLYTERLQDELSGGPKTSVLVAAEDIPISATLTEKRLAVREIPRAYLESRHVKAADMKLILGQRVTGGIKANEAILTTDVAKLAERRQLSGLVSNGMRAIAIDGRAADFDGLLRPGDRVDVLLSMGGSVDSSGATYTLLQNLLVLSVGGTTLRSDGTDKTYSRGATVTLSASVEQAQVLTEAMRRGKLTLTLRNTEDITIVEGIAETGAKDLVSSRAPEVKTQASAPVGAVEHVR
ncbi:MAG: Flp pilus assembly protein CpaB [Polyangiaceae bacterium]